MAETKMLFKTIWLLLIILVLHQTVEKQFTEGFVSIPHTSRLSERNNVPYTSHTSKNHTGSFDLQRLEKNIETCMIDGIKSIKRCYYLRKYMIWKKGRFLSKRKLSNHVQRNFKKRKLLALIPENTSSVEINDVSIAGSNNRNQTSKTVSFPTGEEYAHFIKVVRNRFSLDPQRALVSLIFLMVVVLAAVKVCKMKVTNQFMEWPHDYQTDVHYMEIYDIIRMKKSYLPKAILNWNRKVRRTLQKREL